MSLDTFGTILAYGFYSLAILCIAVIWVVILVSVGLGVTKFIKQYQASARELKAQEARRAALASQNPDYIDE